MTSTIIFFPGLPISLSTNRDDLYLFYESFEFSYFQRRMNQETLQNSSIRQAINDSNDYLLNLLIRQSHLNSDDNCDSIYSFKRRT